MIRWLFDTDFRIAPIFAIFDGLLSMGVVLIPFELLLTAATLVSNGITLLFLGSYVILKRRHPDKNWIYGKSWKRSITFCIPPSIGTFFAIYYNIQYDSTFAGIPRFNLTSSFIVLGVGIVGQIVYQCVRRRLHIAEGAHGAYEMVPIASTESMPRDVDVVDATVEDADEDRDSLAALKDTDLDEPENMFVISHALESGLPL